MNKGNYYGMPLNLFKTNTDGNTNNRDGYTSSSSSSSSSDNEDENLAEGYVDSNFNANYHQNESKLGREKLSSNKTLSLEIVHIIDNELDMQDTISLVFLLYESQVALNVILTILSAGPYNFSRDLLSKWARSNPPNWSMVLIEALSLIQNYKILNNLGYRKTKLEEKFNTSKNVLYVDKIKKVLYQLCEFLSKDQEKELTERVCQDVTFDNDITTKQSVCLEFNLLFWISRGYLNIQQDVSLTNLTKHLKCMGLLEKVEEIENVVNIINNEKKSMFCYPHFDESDVYLIKDPVNVGVCVIVNMALFRKNVEKCKELKHLLPPEPLDDREGSIMDVKNLKETFTYLKFLVVEIHNVFHHHLESSIQNIIKEKFKKNVHSILVLCILSHGDKGVVYAANSIPVKLQNIQNIISGPTPVEDLLANIPKVIIIQACQGRNPLFVELNSNVQEGKECLHKTNQLNFDGNQSLYLDGSGLVFDSPQQFCPKYADVLTCLAIIEGFVAVRSVKEGTKYIQELCQCLKKYYKSDHLLDIITRVHNNLNSKAMHVATEAKGQFNCAEHANCLCIYMTPEAKHTLRKKLYLTPLHLLKH